ncbi:helix-turn-helix domain-containing protein [Candidatus Omnitrophota bacterium]
MRVGDRIRQLRKEKKVKRSDLVRKMQFIYGDKAVDYRTIERIEKGDIVKGRHSTLLQIADALDVDINDLLKDTAAEDKARKEELEESVYLVRKDTRGGIFRYNDKASIEIISPEVSSYIAFLLSLQPGGKTKLEQDPEGTIKFLFVNEGELLLTAGRIERSLSKGDSVQINSHKPHFFENKTKRPASAILFQNPKSF